MMDNIAEIILEKLQPFSSKKGLMEYRNEILTEMTYHDFFDRVQRTLSTIKKFPFLPGERILFLSENSIDALVACFAFWLAEMTIVFLDYNLPQKQLLSLVEQSQSRAIAASSECLEKVNFLLNQPYLVLKINEGCHLQTPNQSYSQVFETLRDPNQACLLFTSGTTGAFKGVMISHRNLLASLKASQIAVALTPHDRYLAILPLYHVFPLTGLLTSLFTSATLCLSPKFDGKILLQACALFKPTILLFVPRIITLLRVRISERIKNLPPIKKMFIQTLIQITSWMRKIKLNFLSRLLLFPLRRQFGGKLSRIIVGGAALTVEEEDAMQRIGLDVYCGYGMTEISGPCATNTKGKRKIGSAGIAMIGIEFDLKEVEGFLDKELIIKGEQVMVGYFNDPVATQSVLHEGWLKTGDLARIDSNGFLSIVGRSKEIIVTASGKKIFPHDIDLHYQNIEGIAELASFGVTSSRGGEEIHAAIVATDKIRKELEDNPEKETQFLLNWEKECLKKSLTLPEYYRIKELHLLKELPKTITQKIKRHFLKEQFAKKTSKSATVATDNLEFPIPPTEQTLKNWMRYWISVEKGYPLDEVQWEKSLIYHEFDSLDIENFTQKITLSLNFTLSPSSLSDCSSLNEVVEFIMFRYLIHTKNHVLSHQDLIMTISHWLSEMHSNRDLEIHEETIVTDADLIEITKRLNVWGEVQLTTSLFPVQTNILSLAEQFVELKRRELNEISNQVQIYLQERIEGILSYQEDMLFRYMQHVPNNPGHSIYCCLEIDQKIDEEQFYRALTRLVEKHEMLNACYKQTADGHHVRKINQETKEIAYHVEDCTHLTKTEFEHHLIKECEKIIKTPFDIENGPLYRFQRFEADRSKTILFIHIHHLITDGMSLKILVEDLMNFYQAPVTPSSFPQPPSSPTYANFASWQRWYFDHGPGKKRIEAFRKYFGIYPEKITPRATRNDRTICTWQAAATTEELLSAFSRKHAIPFQIPIIGASLLLIEQGLMKSKFIVFQNYGRDIFQEMIKAFHPGINFNKLFGYMTDKFVLGTSSLEKKSNMLEFLKAIQKELSLLETECSYPFHESEYFETGLVLNIHNYQKNKVNGVKVLDLPLDIHSKLWSPFPKSLAIRFYFKEEGIELSAAYDALDFQHEEVKRILKSLEKNLNSLITISANF